MFAVDSVGGGACREAFFSRRYLNEDDLAALQRHADAKGATPTFLENKVHQPKIEKIQNCTSQEAGARSAFRVEKGSLRTL